MIKDAEREYAAAALYDGGWRAADREQLIAEYEMDADEADAICELLRIYEDRQAEFHKNKFSMLYYNNIACLQTRKGDYHVYKKIRN